MRRLILIAVLLLGGAAILATTARSDDSHTYFIEFDNAFGLVKGSEVKVAGVQQGTIDDFFIDSNKRAVAKVTLSGPLSVLGKDTICSSEPQSLIAEYFIDCIPKGPPLTEGTGSDQQRSENPDIPVKQTRQTVQQDLVQDALRMPFRDRLAIIIDEFGTGLAGNPENLNAAIKRGAPALSAAHKVTRILASQNTIIRDLNANSDEIVGKLNQRSADVVRFIKNAKATAEVGAAQRENLSKNFGELDNFLAELKPTMTKLNQLAVAQTPLLRDLDASAPGLTELSRNLPDFNRAAAPSLTSLGRASVAGEKALRHGQNEIQQLASSTKKAYPVADSLAKFLKDIDDPRRAVAIDTRAKRDTGRSSSKPGTKDTMGYTGLEGLLNYVFYQAGALTQYDQVSHMLHFSIFEVGTGPCADYNAAQTVPSKSGGETTDPTQIDRCVSWLGPNQPGINSGPDLPPYDPSVCPDGSTDTSICDPNGSATSASTSAKKKSRGSSSQAAAKAGPQGANGGGQAGSGSDSGSQPDSGSSPPDLGDLGSGGSAGGKLHDAIPGGLGDVLGGAGNTGKAGGALRKRAGGGSGSGGSGAAAATNDLLGYLFAD